MAKRKEHVKIGSVDIPENYFDLQEEEKKEICELLANRLYLLVDKNSDPDIDRLFILNKIIDSSIITNELDNNFEVCQVLVDMRKLLNEQTD